MLLPKGTIYLGTLETVFSCQRTRRVQSNRKSYPCQNARYIYDRRFLMRKDAYQLIFSPRLDVAPNDFVSTWNEETTTQTAAEASLTTGDAQSYNPLVDLVSLVLTNVGLGLGTNALYDLIKKVFEKKNQKKHIKITKLAQPDGQHFLTMLIHKEQIAPVFFTPRAIHRRHTYSRPLR